MKRYDSSLVEMLLATKTKFYSDNVDNLWLTLSKKLLTYGNKTTIWLSKTIAKSHAATFLHTPLKYKLTAKRSVGRNNSEAKVAFICFHFNLFVFL